MLQSRQLTLTRLARCSVLSAMLLAHAPAVHAQAAGPLRSQPLARYEAWPDTAKAQGGGTYWQEGAAIGAAAFAIPTFLFALSLCGDSDSGGTDNGIACVAGSSLVMALVGGALGAFVGGAVHKQGTSELNLRTEGPDSPGHGAPGLSDERPRDPLPCYRPAPSPRVTSSSSS